MHDNQQLKPRFLKHLVKKWQMCLICQGDVGGKLLFWRDSVDLYLALIKQFASYL